jgi:hypothetical protein
VSCNLRYGLSGGLFRRAKLVPRMTPDTALISLSLKNRKIVTEITEAGPWYDAEDYHQEYCECCVVLDITPLITMGTRCHDGDSPSLRRSGRTADIPVTNNPGGYECPTHMFYW